MKLLSILSMVMVLTMTGSNGFSKKINKTETPPQLKIMHWNIEGGMLHDAQGKDLNEDISAVAKIIKCLNPDMVSMVEVHNQAMAKKIAELIGMHYVYEYALPEIQGDAILSKYPIEKTTKHNLPWKEWEQRICIDAQINVSGQKVHFYTTHLTFNGKKDKESQVIELLNIMKKESGPRILCGDFNDMDNRPNWYSNTGYINLFTGSTIGTLQPSAPKLYDFQRKCSIPEQVKEKDPCQSLKTDWNPPDTQANTVSQWDPKVRIDHIFLSPDFNLSFPGTYAKAIDTHALIRENKLDINAAYVSDHRPVFGVVALPQPVAVLKCNPGKQILKLKVGESATLQIQGEDKYHQPVSLWKTDVKTPLNNPSITGRMISSLQWKTDTKMLEITHPDLLAQYNPLVKKDLLVGDALQVKALLPGKAVLTISSGAVQKAIPVEITK
jgi:endonuclease/exonuclease/phosphatase family metal-dependent hydrolase